MATRRKRNKIMAGATEALAYARGDCAHTWVYKKSKLKTATWTKHCRKCGVRVTEHRR